MTATKGLGTYGNAAGTVTPLDHKMAQLGLVAKTAANTIRSGLFWDGNTTIVSGKANMSYDVRAFSAVLSRGSTAGAVLLTNDATYNVTTTAAPGSNSRYDVVYVWQREYSLDGTDSNPVIGVVQGTAAASPSVPSLSAYPGAIELARILVPAGVTATNSGTTITQTGVFTAAAGGVLPFRNTTERDAGSYQEGQAGWLIDGNTFQVYDGSSWVSVRDGASVDITSFTPVLTGASGNPNIGSTGTAVGRYSVRNGVCHFWVKFLWGGSGISQGSGNYSVSLPVAHASVSGLDTVVSAWFDKAGSSKLPAQGIIASGGSTVSAIRLADGSGTQLSNAQNMGVAGSLLILSGSYPVA